MESKLLMLFLILFCFSSCKLGTTESLSNSEIDMTIRNQIDMLDQQGLNFIINEDAAGLKRLMSSKMLEVSGNEIDGLLSNLGSFFEVNEYDIIDQYYIENSAPDLSNTLFSKIQGDDNYRIRIKSVNKKSFVSLILPKGGLDRRYILNVYGLYPEGWKLNIMQFGKYTINGKTAPQLFAQAKAEYSKGYKIDAVNSMYLSSKVLKPSQSFKYIKEEDMRNFLIESAKEIGNTYKYPLKMPGIDSEPEILNISPISIDDEGHFPMIEYVTKIDLKDTTATKLENELIQKEIGSIFKGIDKDKKYVLYKAFSSMPDGKTKIPTYSFLQKIKINEE